MHKAKVGVVGCGNISELYFMNFTGRYASEIELVCCTDLDMDKARASAQKYGIQAVSLDAMLNGDSHIVVNITTPDAHEAINRRAIQAGKHVYCEKPLARNFAQARDTVAQAEKKGVLVGCAPDTFLGAGIQTCREVIDQGWLGELVCATANCASPGHEIWHPNPAFYYKAGGGPMMDMGPYYITALVAMLGPIRRVSGFCSKNRPVRTISSQPFRGQAVEVDVPTHYMGILEFESGVTANVTMSFEVWNSKLPTMEVHGTAGSMFCPNPDLFGGPVYLTRGEAVIDQLADMDTSAAGVKGNPFDKAPLIKEIPLSYHDPLKKIRGLGVVDMAHAIRDGRKPRIAHDLILHVTEALCAFETSFASGAPYQMTTRCRRPDAMAHNLGLDQVD